MPAGSCVECNLPEMHVSLGAADTCCCLAVLLRTLHSRDYAQVCALIDLEARLQHLQWLDCDPFCHTTDCSSQKHILAVVTAV